MAVERKDPLPPGMYWIFVLTKELDRWNEWVMDHAATVRQLASQTQTVTPDSPLWGITPSGDAIKDPAGEVIVFSVSALTPWVKLGFPTIVKDPKLSPYQVIDREVASAPDPEPDPSVASLIASVAPYLVFTVLGVVAIRRLIK